MIHLPPPFSSTFVSLCIYFLFFCFRLWICLSQISIHGWILCKIQTLYFGVWTQFNYDSTQSFNGPILRSRLNPRHLAIIWSVMVWTMPLHSPLWPTSILLFNSIMTPFLGVIILFQGFNYLANFNNLGYLNKFISVFKNITWYVAPLGMCSWRLWVHTLFYLCNTFLNCKI